MFSPKKWNRAVRYAVAPVAVALALGCRLALNPILHNASPFMDFFVAILVSAWLGGVGPGLTATVLSLLVVDYIYLQPLYTILGGGLEENINIVFFLILGAVISVIVARMRREQRRAETAADEAQASEIETRRAEEAFRLSEERFATFMRHLPGAAWMKDLQGRYTWVNPEAERIFSKSLGELQGKTDEEIFPPGTARQFCENDHRALTEEGIMTTTEVLHQSDGIDHHAIINKFSIPGPDGQPVFVGGVAIDITERKMVEQRLSEQNLFLKNILESLSHPFYVIDANDYTIKLANSAAGLDIGPLTTCYSLTHGSDVPCHTLGHPCPIEQVKATGKSCTAEHVHYDREGNPRYYEVHAHPVLNHSGELTQIIEYNLDITERKKAEAQLRLQATALEAAANAIVVSDPDGTIRWANPAFAAMTGYDVHEVIGRNPRILKSGKHDKAFYRAMWETIQRGETWHGELLNRRKDGTLYNEEMVIAPVVDERGGISHYIAIKQDITERKRVETRLKDSERRLTDIIEFLPDATFALDNAGRVIAWNKAMEELTGAPATEVLGKGNHEYSYRLYGKRIPCLADEVLRGDQPDWSFSNVVQESDIVKAETFISHLKPGGVWLSIKIAPIYDAQCNVVGVIDACRDITERKRNEDALRQSEAHLQRVLDSVFTFMGVLTPEGIMTYVNRPVYEASGLDPAQVIGRTIWEAKWWSHSESVSRQVCEATEQARRGETVRFDTTAIVAGGRVIDIDFAITPMRDEQGRMTHLIASAIDITERKRIEDSLKAADQRKDEFMAMLAHELRNPLAPIRYAAQMLHMNGLAHDQIQKQREVIDRQVSHMSRLLDDLLEVSRITRGMITLKREIVDLRIVATQALDSLRPMIEGRGQHLLYEGPSSPLLVDGDPTRLEQIIRNILHNANKYTEAGGCIKLSLVLETEPEWRVAVRVSDSGIGIPPEMLPIVFEAFVQAEQGLARSQGGLGIGLAMVKNLVQMHGGSVEAHSAGPGRGSEFIVRLPLAAEVLGELKNVSAPEEQYQAALAEPRRVLVVDDNEDSAASLSELLSLWGHEIQTAHDGRHALAAARKWQPEIILLDIGLPGMDGYEVARYLREDPATNGIFLVALTGYGQEEDRRRAREAGFNWHLTKPVELEQLQNILHEGHE